MPAKGTSFSASNTAFLWRGSVNHTPGVLKSAGIAYLTRPKPTIINTAKIKPEMAAPRGGARSRRLSVSAMLVNVAALPAVPFETKSVGSRDPRASREYDANHLPDAATQW